jgi:hypothetical protein
MSRYRHAGAVLAGHTFSVPLDHDRPEGDRIEIFAREMAPADRASARLPWLLFLPAQYLVAIKQVIGGRLR